MQATYRHERGDGLRSNAVERFTLSLGPVEQVGDKRCQWLALRATKVNGRDSPCGSWAAPSRLGRSNRPQPPRPATSFKRAMTRRRNSLTGSPARPCGRRSAPGKPLAAARTKRFPRWHPGFARDLAGPPLHAGSDEPQRFIPRAARAAPTRPAAGRAGRRAEQLAHADETRRYDGSDYAMVRTSRSDYAEMIRAGMNCFAWTRTGWLAQG